MKRKLPRIVVNEFADPIVDSIMLAVVAGTQNRE